MDKGKNIAEPSQPSERSTKTPDDFADDPVGVPKFPLLSRASNAILHDGAGGRVTWRAREEVEAANMPLRPGADWGGTGRTMEVTTSTMALQQSQMHAEERQNLGKFACPPSRELPLLPQYLSGYPFLNNAGSVDGQRGHGWEALASMVAPLPAQLMTPEWSGSLPALQYQEQSGSVRPGQQHCQEALLSSNPSVWSGQNSELGQFMGEKAALHLREKTVEAQSGDQLEAENLRLSVQLLERQETINALQTGLLAEQQNVGMFQAHAGELQVGLLENQRHIEVLQAHMAELQERLLAEQHRAGALQLHIQQAAAAEAVNELHGANMAVEDTASSAAPLKNEPRAVDPSANQHSLCVRCGLREKTVLLFPCLHLCLCALCFNTIATDPAHLNVCPAPGCGKEWKESVKINSY